MEKKFDIIAGTEQEYGGYTISRIKALRDFADVTAGDFGGYVQFEENLSQTGDCWVYPGAIVIDEAKVLGDAKVKGASIIMGNATICGRAVVKNVVVSKWAQIYDDAKVFCPDGNSPFFVGGYAKIFGKTHVAVTSTTIGDAAKVFDHARVEGNGIYIGGQAMVCGDAIVRDYARISGNAKLYEHAGVGGGPVFIYGDAIIHGNTWIRSGSFSQDADISDVGQWLDTSDGTNQITFFRCRLGDIKMTCRHLNIGQDIERNDCTSFDELAKLSPMLMLTGPIYRELIAIAVRADIEGESASVNSKYQFTGKHKYLPLSKLKVYQIRAIRDIGDKVKAGDIGGWIEKESNLSVVGDSWITSDTVVTGAARVFDNAYVEGSTVCGHAKVCGNTTVSFSRVCDYAKVSGDAFVYDSIIKNRARVEQSANVQNTTVQDDAVVHGHAVVTKMKYPIADKAVVGGDVSVSGHVRIYGCATIDGDAELCGDFCAHGHATVSGGFFSAGEVCWHAKIESRSDVYVVDTTTMFSTNGAEKALLGDVTFYKFNRSLAYGHEDIDENPVGIAVVSKKYTGDADAACFKDDLWRLIGNTSSIPRDVFDRIFWRICRTVIQNDYYEW